MNRINDEIRRDSRKNPEQLEREIDATRAELQATLEELEHRLSPSDLFEQVWSRMRRHGGEFGGNLGHSLKENPVPALLTSIGIAWMMASNGRQHDGHAGSSRTSREKMHQSRERMRQRWQGAREAVRRRGESAREGVSSARDTLSGSARSASERAHEMSSAARYRAERARAGFGNLLEEQPLLLGAIGLAAGVIAGAALPPTEQEDRTLGAARDRALERAKAAGAEQARRAREKAESMAEAAKSSMQDDGGREHRTPEQNRDQRVAPDVPESATRTSSPGTGLGY